jgi:DNA-binding beta-propeller fold protein YncE
MTAGVASQIVPSHCIGRGVQSGPGFNLPVSVAAATGGRLYVVSRANMAQAPRNYLRVTICTIDEEYLGQFTEFGTDDGQITWPSAVAVGKDGKVFVGDEARQDIQVFDADGIFLSKWGSKGSGPGQVDRPAALAIDLDGNVLVSDSMNNRIQRLTPDGKYLGEFGKAGTGPGEFNMPWGLAVDKQGFIYVADWRNARVQKFDRDGNFQMSFGDRDGEGRLERPAGVGVDSVGNVYVSDYARHVVQCYTADGSHFKTLEGDGQLSKWATTYVAADPEMTLLRAKHPAEVEAFERPFEGPLGITVDDEDRVIICDSVRNRLQVYQRR